MYKNLLLFSSLFIFNISLLFAEKIEITADSIESTHNSIIAKNNILVYYEGSFIKANSATYNKTKKLLVLDGNVEIIGYKGTKEHTNRLEIYTQKKEVLFNELFLITKDDIWLYSKKVHKYDSNYTLGNSVISSCEVDKPLWKMVFEHSLYNSKENYIKMYNTKVYFLDVPIFYTPYLAFSTHKQRSSGLLFPALIYSKLEGFLYEQPIYWAISPSMDLELNPQIRTNRSVGIYGTFRFVDSAYSSGVLRTGYVKDKTKYILDNNLPHNSHYGLEFKYQSSKLLSSYYPNRFVDGLYVNTIYLNDIDYLNLQHKKLSYFGSNPLQESRVNYFAYNNDYYFGINAKYFIDTRKEDNSNTLQILPAIQIHKFLQSYLSNNLTYSVDMNFNNFYRKDGVTMRQAEFRLPLEFSKSFFNDFINLSLGEELYYSKFLFANGKYDYSDYDYFSNIHNINIFTDLTKKYDSFIHVLQPSIEYIKPGSEHQSPVNFSSLKDNQKELFTVGLPEEQLDFSLSQYIYDDMMNIKFYQRLTQKYYFNRDYSWGDIKNEMQYNLKDWSFYNNIIYSYKYSKIRESSTNISLYKEDYSFDIGHTYKKILPDMPNSISGNDLDFSFKYKYSDNIDFYGGLTYNIDRSTSKQWSFGGKYHIDCWSVDASMREDITPRPSGFTRSNTFYIQFDFKPFGSIGSGSLHKL